MLPKNLHRRPWSELQPQSVRRGLRSVVRELWGRDCGNQWDWSAKKLLEWRREKKGSIEPPHDVLKNERVELPEWAEAWRLLPASG